MVFKTYVIIQPQTQAQRTFLSNSYRLVSNRQMIDLSLKWQYSKEIDLYKRQAAPNIPAALQPYSPFSPGAFRAMTQHQTPTNVNQALDTRREHRGLIGIQSKIPVKDTETLSLVYTPGVAKPCIEIAKRHLASFDYTIRGNTIAVISDGSSVYGLGNAGPNSAIPMLEARSAYHKHFAGIDAMPIALNTQDIGEIVETIRYLAPTFGGIHLDAISSPRCFAIDERLKRAITLPVMQTEQEAAAVTIYGALINALRVVGKKLENCSVVVSGSGASGISIAKLLHRLGVGKIRVCDRHGSIFYRRLYGLNWVKSELAHKINPEDEQGSLEEIIKGADVFIGLSNMRMITPAMIKTMAKDPVVFLLSLSPDEISYQTAKEAGARVVASALCTDPNQINSSLVFPGIFRGALDVRATNLTHEMFDAAALAYADSVSQNDLAEDMILPDPLAVEPTGAIARAVAKEAIASNNAQVIIEPDQIEEKVRLYHEGGSKAWVPDEDPAMKNESTDIRALDLHQRYQGTMEMTTHVPIVDRDTYNNVYSAPNSSAPCKMIEDNPALVHDLTLKNNLVGIVTDGSAVLGLGNIGPAAGLPVMEGKAVLFKTFGGVEGFPICLRTQETDEIIEAVKRIAPVFGGINLEDIAAPQCFEIEQRLSDELDIPVFHDDQHGTAVVVLAGMINAVKLAGKHLSDIKLVVNGAGASALSVSQLLMKAGVRDIVICDRSGALYPGRANMNPFKEKMAAITNLNKHEGSLQDVLKDADAFLGLSAPGTLTGTMIQTMADDPIIFALANPTPEIMPDEAKEAGVRIMATGRSDFPNQVNNSLAFPGIFRGALDVQAMRISDDMKLAAAKAIARFVSDEELAAGKIIPGALDIKVPPAVAEAVAHAAIQTGMARKTVSPKLVGENLKQFIESSALQPKITHTEMSPTMAV